MMTTHARKKRSEHNRMHVGQGMTVDSKKQSADSDVDHPDASALKRDLSTGSHEGAVLRSGKVIQPERELRIKHETDVLVVGGGPAGVAAAVSARRTGANVALIERYGCFGGLFTAGMVLYLQGTYARLDNGDSLQVSRGINDEVIKRLLGLGRGGVLYEKGADPTVDPEAAKYVLGEMVREAGVKVFLHCWGVDAVMDGHQVRGAVFESKSGRQAIRSKVLIDTSGDGDIFAAAGAEYKTYSNCIGLVHRLINAADDQSHKTPIPLVRWVHMMGEKADGLDVDVLTRLEMDYRKEIWEQVQKLRELPGNENVFLLDIASQLGIRTTRLLEGVTPITQNHGASAGPCRDVIGVASPSAGSRERTCIPYGALVPKRVDQLLVAGRCASGMVRLIPACFTTGQAAGVAAALSVKYDCAPRHVDIAQLQKILKDQGAYLEGT